MQLLILTAIAAFSQSSSALRVLPKDQKSIYWQRNNELRYAQLTNVVEKLNGKDCFKLYPDENAYMNNNGAFNATSVYMDPYVSNNYIILKHYKRVYHSVFGGQDWVEYFPMEGKLKVSLDGKRIILPNGVEYNKVITRDNALALERQRDAALGGQSYGGYNGSSGSSSSSSSGSYNRSSTSNHCKICGGSGTCASCSGRKGSWQDTGYYVGDGSKSWIPCSSCRGTGRCYMCHGTGRL